MVQINENGFIDATNLHIVLESKTPYHTWIKRRISDADLIEGKDFCTSLDESTGGRKKTIYLFTKDAAKEICLLEQNTKGKEIRRWLIGLSNKVENNKLLTIEKTALVVQMINTFKFGEYQIEAEKLHKDTFMLSTITKENIHKLFGQYRNELLDINNYELKQGLIDAYQKGLINTPKGKNIRTRLFHLDKYVLVRNAVADYLLSIGVNTHDALTFADSVKMVAELTNLEIKIKNEDTLFQHKENVAAPIELSKQEIITKLLK
jgi:phage anti-repressor protein